MWSKIFRKYIENPYAFFISLANRGLLKWLPDKPYLMLMFRGKLGHWPDLRSPKTFSEKLQWLKLHDRDAKYTSLVDKYEVKRIVAKLIGDEYIIPTLGVWERFEDIDFDSLPNRFVLKCTHDSGGLIICRDKSQLNIKEAKEKIEKSLKVNYFYHGREWPYKNVRPRIIAEEYMEAMSGDELLDYKLMVFHGRVKCSFVCSGRFSDDGLKVTFYDDQWKRMPFERKYPAEKRAVARPQRYDEMVILAEKLSMDSPFVRVDFYEVNGKIFFGELTFYPGSGMEPFRPEEYDELLGSWIRLPMDDAK